MNTRRHSVSTTILVLTLAFVGGVALLLGLGLGMLAGPPPEVRTKEVRVEVPGPTREVEVPVEVVRTKEVTPEACRTAIAAAEDLGETTARLMEDFSEWPLLVPQAYDAGLTMSQRKADKVIGSMDDLTRRHEKSLAEVETLVAAFNDAKAGC